MMLISFFSNVFDSKKDKEPIFISSKDPNSNCTLLIEEDEYSVWAYLLRPDKEGIDFDGFLCAVQDPKTIQINVKEAIKNGVAPPLSTTFANKYSYVKKLRKQDIRIVWEDVSVMIYIKDELYLIMNLQTRISYSKGISKRGPFGEPLENN